MADETLSARIQAEDAASAVIRQFLQNLRGISPVFAGISSAAVSVTAGLAAAAAGVILAGHAFAKQSEEIRKNALVLGTSTQEVAAYGEAAEVVGTNLETITQASLRMNSVLQLAAQGFGAARRELASYGIDARALVDLPLLEQFGAVAQALRNIQDPGERARATVRLLGLSLARELGPALLDTRTNWNQLVDEMRAKGTVFDPETTDKVAKAKEEWRRLTQVLGDVRNALVADQVSIAVENIEYWRVSVEGLVGWYEKLVAVAKAARDQQRDLFKEPFGTRPGEERLREKTGPHPFSPDERPAGVAPVQDIRAGIDEYVQLVEAAEVDVRNSVLRTQKEWDDYFAHIGLVAERTVRAHAEQMQKLPEAVRNARDIITKDFFGREPLPILNLQPFGDDVEEARQSLREILTEADNVFIGLSRVGAVMTKEFDRFVSDQAQGMLDFVKYSGELMVQSWAQATVRARDFAEIQKEILLDLAAFALQTFLMIIGRAAFSAIVSGLGSLGGGGGGNGTPLPNTGGDVILAGNVPVRRPVSARAPDITQNITIHAGFGTRSELLQASQIIASGLKELGAIA